MFDPVNWEEKGGGAVKVSGRPSLGLFLLTWPISESGGAPEPGLTSCLLGCEACLCSLNIMQKGGQMNTNKHRARMTDTMCVFRAFPEKEPNTCWFLSNTAKRLLSQCLVMRNWRSNLNVYVLLNSKLICTVHRHVLIIYTNFNSGCNKLWLTLNSPTS